MASRHNVLAVRHNVLLRRRGPDGEWTRTGHNLVVGGGYALAAQIFSGLGGTRPTHFALGSDGTATTLAMTALQGTEYVRQAFSSTTLGGATVTYTATIAGSGSWQVSEIGIFNAGTGGTMFARFVTQTFTLSTGSSLEISWQVEFGEDA